MLILIHKQEPLSIANMKNNNINLDQLDEQGGQIVFAPQNGKPGYRVKKSDGSLGQWVPVSPSEYNKPGLKADIERYVQSGGKVYTPPKPKPEKPKPEKPKPEPAKPAPAPAPEASRPAPARPAPTPARQPASQASPVTQYMKAAAAARKSGDPAEMAKVRDMGMKIWSSTPANQKLAAAAAERERIRGTAQTDNPLMRDMRSRLSLTPSVQAPAVKSLGLGQQSLSQNPNAAIAATPKPAPVTRASVPLTNPTVSEPLKPAKPKQTVKSSYEYDAYDLVLEYLISNGHADTLLEAQYVMMQMSAEHIQSIING